LITDLKKRNTTLILIFLEIIGALVIAMISAIPGLVPEIIAILISTAALFLTLAILGLVIYIRHYLGVESDPPKTKFNPPV